MDGETVLLKPLHALHIAGDGLVPDVLVSQDFPTQGVLDDHQPVVPAPVGLHLDDHILNSGISHVYDASDAVCAVSCLHFYGT